MFLGRINNQGFMIFGGTMIRCLLFISLFIHASLAQTQVGQPAEPQPQQPQPPVPLKKWPTLSGKPPLVVARGGFTGLFPESSSFANEMAEQLQVTEVALFCNLQLTKDGIGFCLTDIRLDNSTNVATVYPDDVKTYNVNGQPVKGWFGVDYTGDVIFKNLSLIQSSMSRPDAFDGQMPVSSVEDVVRGVQPTIFWLNVQYDAFFTEHKLSVQLYVEGAMRYFPATTFISSPEIGFLKAMSAKVNRGRTRPMLILQALDENVIEPTTKQTYGAILKDLAAIKTYASGILVPKAYIWPVGPNNYLGNIPTTLVDDAHKLGLEVYASGFSNDKPSAYNYSFDPTAEYMQFIGSPQFSVDGLLTDFSPTASATVACFASATEPPKPQKGAALIISHNGASGVYPASTDLAYEQAVTDGADIIDCSVQMSKDGVAFCLDSVDLTKDTSAMPTFATRSSSVPEIQKEKGIFSFDLTWTEIQGLKPQMFSPFRQNTGLNRNPEAQNKGKLITLSDFLEFAKTKAVSGIWIDIENAAYLAKRGFDMIDCVTKALANATFDKQQTQLVFIQSEDSSVLLKFKGFPTYKRLLRIPEEVANVPKQTIDEIKKYAEGVVVTRPTVISVVNGFTNEITQVLAQMRAANISVYVSVFRNEYVAFPYDYYSDPVVEIATYVAALEVNGIITEFPATASRYMRSPCVALDGAIAVIPAEPGALLAQVPAEPGAPPAGSPNPTLEVDDIVDPPLPPVGNTSSSTTPNSGGGSNATPTSSSSPTPKAAISNIGLCLAAVMAISLSNIVL